jgi:hypothetical protein
LVKKDIGAKVMDTEQIQKHIDDLKAEAEAHFGVMFGLQQSNHNLARAVECIVLASALTATLWEAEAAQDQD